MALDKSNTASSKLKGHSLSYLISHNIWSTRKAFNKK